jgi:hypothetical protein
MMAGLFCGDEAAQLRDAHRLRIRAAADTPEHAGGAGD